MIRAAFLVGATLCLVAACRSAPRDGAEQVTADSVAGVPAATTPAAPPPDSTPPAAPPATTPPAAPSPSTSGPAISSLVPDSVRLAPNTISDIVIRGSGFASTATNTVRIGPVVLRGVRGNAAGTEIPVTVPTRYSTNQEAPPRPLFPADYPVTVETGGQTSNSKMLKVLP
jgi:hypothetical protein